MKKSDIIENLYPEDYMIAAVNLEYKDESIIRKTSIGVRNAKTIRGKVILNEPGKKIWAELERLAKINMMAKNEKKTVSL